MTQPFDTQSPPAQASGVAVAEPPALPAPGRDIPMPDDQAKIRKRAAGGQKAGRSKRIVPAIPRVPVGPAAAIEPDEPALDLNVDEVAGVVGLGHEVRLLRAAIRRLAAKESAAPHVKTLAELRHQVEALCTALKTQHALDGRDDLSADLARALDELGDELGVPR